jgi:hypothetical protein
MKCRNVMREYRGIGTPPRKAPFKKSPAILELERLANIEARQLHPTLDPKFLAPRLFRDDSANSLTQCILTYLGLQGAFVSRLNNPGIFDKNINRYRPGTSKKGLPDILCTHQGRSIMIEVKFGSDRMSEHQKKIRDEQTASGGLYFIAHDFTTFKQWFDRI